MTQTSRPAGTDSTTWPNSDAGPYNADQWSQIYQTLFTGDQHATQGPLIRYLNELIGTVNVVGPPAEIRVDTGAAMVNGHWFESDATVDFTLAAPAVNPRIDVVVIAVNNTAVDFAVSDGGFNLDFPDNLADYGADADIEEYSCRLCIVQGVENVAPVAPGLDANNNHWMIPLYQYQISVAGAISGQTDRRDFCEFSTDIPDDTITDAMLRNSAATSVIGRAGAGVGDPADIVAGVNDRVLAQAGGTLSFQQVSTAMIAANAATDTIIRDSVARSVIGRAAAAGGDPADIVAGADNQVLARTGGTLAFQAVVPAMVTDRTRKFFVQCVGGWNVNDNIALSRKDERGWELVDAKECYGHGNFIVPNDFASGMTVTAVVVPWANGNVWSANEATYSACTEVFNTHGDAVAPAAVAVTTVVNCIQIITLTNEAIGDIVNLEYDRDATNVLDTINQIVWFSGWIVEYTADS